MNFSFDFFSPRQVVFGWGRRTELAKQSANFGQEAWIVCGSRTLLQNGTIQEIQCILQQTGCKSEVIHVQSREPTIEDVDNTTKKLRQLIDKVGSAAAHWILAIGGGSAIDLAKAVAIMITNAHGASVADFLEGIGTQRVLSSPPLPVLAMPTTAGTGSEATKNAVITSNQLAVKKSLRSPTMIPAMVIVDSELSATVPPNITAWSGFDAVTQLIESYVSCRSNSLSRGIILAGAQNVLPALSIAFHDGANREAREIMARAAYCSGLALANSGLGMAHGVAAALGAHYSVPHGLACAIMLPTTLRTNFAVCKNDFATLAPIVCDRSFSTTSEAAFGLIDAVQELCDQLQIPRSLTAFDVKNEQIPLLVKSSRGNSMTGNPQPIDDAELTSIFEKLL